jgi:Spy/CpxP family protein refolding chaperone
MKIERSILTVTLIAAAATAWAQFAPPDPQQGQVPPGPQPPQMQQRGPGQAQRGGPQGDPMAENFFPPELVMQNQQVIGLTDEQKTTIRETMQKFMGKFTDLQWQQSAEQETMNSLLKQEHPDETKVLAQLDKVLKIENEIKRIHLSIMIKIKNTLTTEQQAKLRQIMRQPWMPPMGAQQGQPPPGGPRE